MRAVRFRVRVTPRAGRDGIDGVRDGVLRVRVSAPPVDGAANTAVVELLARTLGVPRRAVAIVAGEGSRAKTVAVEGLDPGALRRIWPDLGV